MSKKAIIALFLIFFIGILLRLVLIEQNPYGLNTDEASLGYNAYSILKTGKDEYGKSFPVYFRSFGNFQSPLYTYLTVPAVSIFGLSIFSTRFISILSGVLVILFSFLFIHSSLKHKDKNAAFITAFVIAVSPWAIYFSRIALEANLGLMLIVLSVMLLALSLGNSKFLIISAFTLATSTYAYHAERIAAFLLFGSFLLIFKKVLKDKKIILLSIFIFILMQIPQLLLINTPASSRRFTEVNYIKDEVFLAEGGVLKNIFLGRYLFFTSEFVSRYISYFSPKNLFADLAPSLAYGMPNMSLFYPWMVIPLLLGIKRFLNFRSQSWVKILLILIFISPIPGAITREAFYTVRTLPLFWSISIIIALGIGELFAFIKKVHLLIPLVSIIFLVSTVTFLISYFVLFKYEHANGFQYPYIQLVKKADELKDVNFIVDTARDPSAYILFAFFRKADPVLLQQTERSKEVLKEYYTNIEINDNAVNIDNLITKFVWSEELCKEQIVVGDLLAISDQQAERHKLKPAFEINDLNGKVYLKAYYINPKETGCE